MLWSTFYPKAIVTPHTVPRMWYSDMVTVSLLSNKKNRAIRFNLPKSEECKIKVQNYPTFLFNSIIYILPFFPFIIFPKEKLQQNLFDFSWIKLAKFEKRTFLLLFRFCKEIDFSTTLCALIMWENKIKNEVPSIKSEVPKLHPFSQLCSKLNPKK